jgi:hypothetical protein
LKQLKKLGMSRSSMPQIKEKENENESEYEYDYYDEEDYSDEEVKKQVKIEEVSEENFSESDDYG